MRRVLNMFWMFWLVMASFWTFSADTCDVTSPLLYTFSLVIVLIHLAFFGMIREDLARHLLVASDLFNYQAFIDNLYYRIGPRVLLVRSTCHCRYLSIAS